jgi:hypothetical protein
VVWGVGSAELEGRAEAVCQWYVRSSEGLLTVVLEESIEVANVLVRLQASEKAVLELREKSGRDRGVVREVQEPDTKTETNADTKSAEDEEQSEGTKEDVKIEGKGIFPEEDGHDEKKIYSNDMKAEEDKKRGY